MLQAEQMAATMDQHGLPSLTLRHIIEGRTQELVVNRTDLEPDARAVRDLPLACAGCPVGVLTELNGSTPGCRARIGYPIDDHAVEVIREALELNADQAETDEDLALVRALVADRDCDGSRMYALIRRLEALPAPIGFAPVDFTLDGRTVPVSAYMLLEHLCFRRTLDRAGQAALLRWFSYFFQAVGERIAVGTDVFGRSPSLAGLNVLHKVVERAHQAGRGMTFDG
jgi:hypothetical protein